MTQNLAFVFPGQGSQSIGMLSSLIADNQTLVYSICQEASDVLEFDMLDLIQNDPKQILNQTQFTQPALLTVGVIAWRIWQACNPIPPKFFAGHSLGEYTALVCAKALTFAEGLRLVSARGMLMQLAVPQDFGAMAAILGMNLQDVNDICKQVTNVQAANINAPGQIVIAGTKQAVLLAMEKAKEKGAKRAIILPVSVPSHCDLMRPAAQKFVEHLNMVKWQKPQIPVIHNFDVRSHDNAQEICQVLQYQLYSPVRWVETIEYFVQQGIEEIIECAPGNVLCGLNKRIAPTINARSVTETFGAPAC